AERRRRSVRLRVTGGMGFIGSNFIRLLLDERPEWEIWNVDALTYAGNPENLSGAVDSPEAAGRYRFLHADIADGEALREIFAGARPDAVVNFAAESHVDRSIES